MKYFVAVLALAAVAFADVSHLRNPDQDAQILRNENDVSHDQFQYAYETSNGISAQESGSLKTYGPEEAAIEVIGSNAYTAPDGKTYSVTYVADANGYQPKGEHLPTPPAPLAIPEYILRALEYIRTHPPKVEPSYKA